MSSTRKIPANRGSRAAAVTLGLVSLLAVLLGLAPFRSHEAGASHVNPGFETGTLFGWAVGATVEGVSVVGTDVISAGEALSQAPLEGSFMARLGEPAASHTETQPIGQNELFQNFTINENFVKFAYNLWTYDYTGYDRFSIQLKLTASNTVIYSHSQEAWGAPHDRARKTPAGR